MKRALAIIGVVLMLAVAVFIRSRVSDSKQVAADEKAKATLYCAKELEPVCEDLKANDRNLTVVNEDASRTLATLTAADFNRATTKIDGWLAPQAYIDLANDARSRAGLDAIFSQPSRVLARSPVVIVGYSERLKALAGACGGQVSWKCVGEKAGSRWSDFGGQEQWGTFDPVLPDPSGSATGLLAASEAVASYFGNTSFASNDFSDTAFRDWQNRLARSSAGVQLSGLTPIGKLLNSGVSAMGLTAALEAQAAPAVATSRDKDKLSILYPSPLATADVVLAPITGSEPGGRLKDVLESDDAARSLAQHGWRVGGQPLSPELSTTAAIPDTNGLPKPGVLQALQNTWQAGT